MKEKLYFDKDFEKIEALNRSYMFGEGVFETFAYKKTLPIFFKRHLDRLQLAAKFIGIKYPGDAYIESFVKKSTKNHPDENLIVKISLLSTGSSQYYGQSEVTTVCVSIKTDVEDQPEISLTVSDVFINPNNPIIYHKTNNYLLNSIERKNALEKGFDEALYLNTNNFVSETTSGNIFWVKGSTIFTPDLSCGMLPGISRALLIETCQDQGIKVEEGSYELGSILFPEAVFVTNSSKGLTEVTNIDNVIQPTRTAKLFPKIRDAFLKKLDWS
tara:strand:+ start:53714 stop:54529 length:816 start_codon:yes stop_codon:yes gene_type:complete